MDAETHRKVDELIAAQINALYAEMCKPENPPATYGRFRAFLYRADRHHEHLMMQTRWYPLVIGVGLVGTIMAGTATVITYFAKGG